MTGQSDEVQVIGKLVDAVRGLNVLELAITRLADEIAKLNETLKAARQSGPPNSPSER